MTIQIKNISKSFNNKLILKSINFNANKISIFYKNKELDTSFFNDDKLEDKVKMTSNVIQAISTNVS